jgi:hypothetical protein
VNNLQAETQTHARRRSHMSEMVVKARTPGFLKNKNYFEKESVSRLNFFKSHLGYWITPEGQWE